MNKVGPSLFWIFLDFYFSSNTSKSTLIYNINSNIAYEKRNRLTIKEELGIYISIILSD